MRSKQIKLSPDEMRIRARDYHSEAAKLGETIKQSERMLRSLQGEWEGAASLSYSERFAQLKPSLVATCELLQETARGLESTAKLIEETDRDIANRFKV
ncbi:MAG: WXG100 family type VII secretion target [Oscillospiraceae bacterium]|jgi:WXG100 family type VII secretion target|nr:WXG100 family type VII secretion target [Oscillospiraceae bacterium]